MKRVMKKIVVPKGYDADLWKIAMYQNRNNVKLAEARYRRVLALIDHYEQNPIPEDETEGDDESL